MGRSIYFTDKEISALRNTCGEWSEMMESGEDTIKLIDERLNEGLGSAMKKLYGNCAGAEIYKKNCKECKK